MLAKRPGDWTPRWNETHSRSYGLSERSRSSQGRDSPATILSNPHQEFKLSLHINNVTSLYSRMPGIVAGRLVRNAG